MSHRLVYKILGYLSILIGFAAALSIYKIQFAFYGIALGLLGFIVSGINIFLNMKYYSDEEKYPKGYIGMLLSSLPVLFMLFVIMKNRH
ncbi:MAG: hypothetical protein Q7W45_08955 [Bacteroidota bacterium]|nr:hypothetical protein [Bacteroidota bacterium]MDP3144195.1 hypothetical protein [Bacteroidota bacterium]